jgi:predicted Fe-Mo cluster-binding NifX family protein
MKICLPVDQLNGLASEIAPDFRVAPALLVVDSVTRQYLGIDARSGACRAAPQQIDAIVCAGGIGRGMFNGLRGRGIRVFNSAALTVEEALAELAGGSLREVSEVEYCCGGHHGEAHDRLNGQGCGGGGALGGAEHGGCGCGHH